jgi:hypothetical protein
MDRASQVLAQALPVEVPMTYAALSDWGDVPLTTIYHRAHGRRSKEEYAQSRQYLTPEEEKAIVKFLLLMSSLGHPVRIKFLPSFALSIARRRSSQTCQEFSWLDGLMAGLRFPQSIQPAQKSGNSHPASRRRAKSLMD